MTEPEKEISLIEEGKAFFTKITERKKTIDNLKKFIADNISSSQDIKIKNKVEETKNLLELIKKEV